MHCLKCDETDRLDRVVVDTLTGAEVGGLCDTCLETGQSSAFEDDIWRADSDCAVCAEVAQYELPLIECRIEYPDCRPDEVEYVLTDATLRLCTEHLRVALTESPTDSPPIEAIVSQ